MEKLILYFGSRIAAADAIGVTPSFLTMVKKGKRRFSAELAMSIEELTGGVISKTELRPDIYRTESK